MTNVIQFPTKQKIAKPPITTPDNPLNMFSEAPFFEKLIANQQIAIRVHEELKSIMKAGSQNKSRNPLEAPSLAPLRMVKRRGRTLNEALLAALAFGSGHNQTVLNQFGIQVMHRNPTSAQEREMDIAIDLRYHSKAEALFKRAGVPNWRTLVVQDCELLVIKPMTGHDYEQAWAYFRIGGKNRRKREPDIFLPSFGDSYTM